MDGEQHKWGARDLFVGIVALALLTGSLAHYYLSPLRGRAQESEASNRQYSPRLASDGKEFEDVPELAEPIAEDFEDEVEARIANKETFIEVDLSKMELYMYREGELYKKVPVLSKGKEGSWWETPTGNYKILTKEKTHFSSIGKVWMPWSMQFYGNYFIHGWPYYEDGTEVSSSYSGGCIRLSTADAQLVYEFAEKSIPVLVRESDEENGFANLSKSSLPAPKVTARSYSITNLATGEKLASKDAAAILPISPLTKIMTGIVASELLYLGRPIEVRQSMLASSLASFQPVAGEEYVAFDLLYPLLMQSSDQAADILAGFIGRNHFVNNMNSKAESLSMKDTRFTDPTGEGENVSSAQDLEKLIRYTYFKRKFILSISKGVQDYRFEGRKLDNLENLNLSIGGDNLVGQTGGDTEAGQVLAGVWEFKTSEGKVPVGIVLLGSEDSAEDTQTLLDWVGQSVE